jgi:hypothetical protein
LSYDVERVGRCLSLAMKATPSTGEHAEMQFPSPRTGCEGRRFPAINTILRQAPMPALTL